MRKYFEINGYWKDDKSEFEGYIVTNYDDVEVSGMYDVDDIFLFGLEESEIIEAIKDGGDTAQDFVITDYRALPTEDEILEEMRLHNEDEVGENDQWNFEKTKYYMLLGDKYYDGWHSKK